MRCPDVKGITDNQQGSRYNCVMQLSQKQKEIVIGTLLVDGYLEFDGFKASRL